MERLQGLLAAAMAAVVAAGCSSNAPPSGAIGTQSAAPAKPQAAVEVPARQEAPAAIPPEALASNDAAANSAKTEVAAPQPHTSFYRADTGPAKIPGVQFSKREQSLSKVKVGDAMPAIELPKVGDNGKAKLASLLGKKATVVVFWKGDRRMSNELLADIAADVIEPFGKSGVEVVGVAVNETAASAPEALTKAGAKFTNLLDADGKAFAQVGSERLPRTYVLDPAGKIVWFDIEYSHATRREIRDALRALTESK